MQDEVTQKHSTTKNAVDERDRSTTSLCVPASQSLLEVIDRLLIAGKSLDVKDETRTTVSRFDETIASLTPPVVPTRLSMAPVPSLSSQS